MIKSNYHIGVGQRRQTEKKSPREWTTIREPFVLPLRNSLKTV